MRNLHTERESTDENLRKLPTSHKSDITWIVLLFISEASKNTQNHTHEGAHYIHLLENACYFLIFAGELKLIFAKLSIESKYIGACNSLNSINGLKQLLYTNLNGQLINLLFHQCKHRFGKHETSFQAFRNQIGGAVCN